MAEKKYDVLALGELLIDFTENAVSSQGNPMFEANPGGAPCNVLAMLNKLGKKTAFMGKVGKDQFGVMLRNVLNELGIGTEALYEDEDVRTTLAFVHTAEDGDRDFAFYRNPGADMMLDVSEVREEMIMDAKIFHFGTLSMTHEGVREATKKGLRIAREHDILISFDPNLRPPLWKSLDEAKEQILYGLGQCDILKISDDEILFVSGCDTIEAGVDWIRERYGNIRLLLATLGKEGSYAYYKDQKVMAKPFLNPNTIETTGAGDTFCACILNYVLEHGLDELNEKDLLEMLTFANGASSLITTRRGALKVMPEKEEVEQYISGR
ncbi:PfkB family carbohydrate kinase [Lachnospiraceae bacterium JLR.KK008]